jgi:hypothetical protein
MLDESSLLRFLESYKILAVSHSLYTQSPEWFGDTYGSLSREWQQHDIVISNSNIHESIRIMWFFWRDVVAINSYTQPLSIEDAVASITNIMQDVHNTITAYQQNIQAQLDATTWAYKDPKTDIVQRSITKILQDADFAQRTYTQNPDISKKLNNSIEELKKMRLSKNIEKVHGIIEQIYTYIDIMEQWHLDTLPQEPLSSESSIQTTFFVRMYDKRERAYKLSIAWGWKSLYTRLWPTIITTQLLIKDIQQSMISRRNRATSVLWDIHFIALCGITITTLIGMIRYIWQQGPIENILGMGLLRTGLLGLSLRCGYIISKRTLLPSSTILLISIGIFACLHYLMMWLLLLD